MTEKNVYFMGREMIDLAEQINIAAYNQNYEDVNVHMRILQVQLMNWVNEVVKLAEVCKDKYVFPDINQIGAVVTDVVTAQESKDYILLADYITLSLRPLILQVQEGLRQVYGNLGCDLSNQTLATNLLEDSVLANQLKDVSVYSLEETEGGYPTLALQDEIGQYYLHSNVSPMREARQFVNQYLQPDKEHYIIVGCGLGYGIRQFLLSDDYTKIVVFETDAKLIKTMLSLWDFSVFIKQKRLRIVYDLEGQKVSRAFAEDEKAQVVIHAPSLRHIKNQTVKKTLQTYFMQESGVRKNDYLMKSNFYQNYRNCVGNVDSLETVIKGKKVVIVAAGPSFYKNCELLKNLPANTIVIAVSTIYRKLLELGIRVDFVIHSDAQKKTIGHLIGIEEQIPLIVLSTAYEGCARTYPGRSYIVYQKDYDLSMQYAGKHGYRLYETGGSVSTTALDVAVQNGADKVIFIGLDLAYTDGLAHAKGVSKQVTGDLSNAPMVDGYYGGKVATSIVFASFIDWFNSYCKEHSQIDCQIINATEGGALIKNMKSMTLEQALH